MKEDLVGPYIVTTDDGRMFHCSISPIESEDQRRWVLRDTDGERYVGPTVTGEQSPTAVRQMVNDWWAHNRNARKS